MKITIEISDNYVQTLSRWASVQRTLTQSRELAGTLETAVGVIKDLVEVVGELIELSGAAPEGVRAKIKSISEKASAENVQNVVDLCQLNAEELEDIGPAIDHLHRQARTVIWELQRKSKENP